jgi:hypothetical protein
VLTAEQLTNAPHLADLFNAVREIPHIADGLRCFCGCARVDGYRSLLSCYEAPGMAQHCEVCQGQARLAHGRWKEGQTLDQIRRATDARYGHGDDAAIAARTETSSLHRRTRMSTNRVQPRTLTHRRPVPFLIVTCNGNRSAGRARARGSTGSRIRLPDQPAGDGQPEPGECGGVA